jgi:hypothetical protein
LFCRLQSVKRFWNPMEGCPLLLDDLQPQNYFAIATHCLPSWVRLISHHPSHICRSILQRKSFALELQPSFDNVLLICCGFRCEFFVPNFLTVLWWTWICHPNSRYNFALEYNVCFFKTVRALYGWNQFFSVHFFASRAY